MQSNSFLSCILLLLADDTDLNQTTRKTSVRCQTSRHARLPRRQDRQTKVKAQDERKLARCIAKADALGYDSL